MRTPDVWDWIGIRIDVCTVYGRLTRANGAGENTRIVVGRQRPQRACVQQHAFTGGVTEEPFEFCTFLRRQRTRTFAVGATNRKATWHLAARIILYMRDTYKHCTHNAKNTIVWT